MHASVLWHYNSTRVCYQPTVAGGAVVVVTGLFTQDVVDALRRDVVIQMHRQGALACLVDLRGSLIAFDEKAHQTRRPPDLAFKARTPVAVLVSEVAAPTFELWAWEMAGQGLPRSVFRDESEAMDWLRDCLNAWTLT